MRNALVLLAVLAVSCGGRSKLVGPQSPSATPPDQATPDAAPPRDGLPSDGPPGPSQPDGLPPITPDLRPADTRPPVTPDGPPLVTPPDGPPFVTPPDGPPFVTPPDGPPFVTPPDVRPDVRPPRPDSLPPARCASEAACTANCTTTCQTIGTMTCTCTAGVLSCGQCQVPPITISPQPCPDNPRSAECAPAGLVCVVYSNGAISGGCLCMTRGGSDASRWTCIMR